MRWTPILAVPAAVMITVPAKATVYLSTEQAQRAIFPGASFTPMPGKSNVWRASTGGFFVVDRVIGKHEYITYAIGINSNGTVKQIEIMVYNESYGYEPGVHDASWRAQFAGKSASAALQVNGDIKNISGATLSTTHVTAGVKRVLAMYESSLKGAR